MLPRDMWTLLIYVGLLVLGCLGVTALGIWTASKAPLLRHAIGFCLAAVSSFALGFVLDMLLNVVTGELQGAVVVAPSFTWTAVAWLFAQSALLSEASPWALATPFFANGLIALLSAVVAAHHAFVAPPLLFVGVLVFRWRRRRGSFSAVPGARVDWWASGREVIGVVLVQLSALGAALLAAMLAGEFVPGARVLVFVVVSVLGLWAGWRRAVVRDRARSDGWASDVAPRLPPER